MWWESYHGVVSGDLVWKCLECYENEKIFDFTVFE